MTAGPANGSGKRVRGYLIVAFALVLFMKVSFMKVRDNLGWC